MAQVAPLVADIPEGTSAWETLKELCGLGYVLSSVLLGVFSLFQFLGYMDNDFLWPGFAINDVSNVLVNVLNTQLSLTTRPVALDLVSPSAGLSAREVYGVNYAYPRQLMYHDLAMVPAAIAGLRALDVSSVIYMVAQYCWVDFEKRWAMAHTERRQARCRNRYVANGAVYMEPVLRNINYNSWALATQGLFMERIGNAVAATRDGPTFLEYLSNHEHTPLQEEIGVWTAHGLTSFELQWANQYQIGLEESVAIENALGLVYLLRLKTVPWTNRGALWTSDYLYAGLVNDFNALHRNESLVRNASTFYGQRAPDWMEYYNVGYPLSAVNQATHDGIGPLANIDLRWVQPPGAVTAAVAAFRTMLLATLEANESVAAMFEASATLSFKVVPPTWAAPGRQFFGGNPMCAFGSGLPFPQASFGFDDACEVAMPLTVEWDAMNSLFALAALGSATASVICAPCSLADAPVCFGAFATATACHAQLPAIDLTSALEQLAPLELSVLQYVGNASSDLSIVTQPLLAPEWAFFGCMGIYDWVLGTREVVSFEGDAGSYTLLSYATPPAATATATVSSTVVIYIWYCAALTSVGLVTVATCIFVQFLVLRPRRCHWLVFHRLTSAAWLSRALVLLRGLAGILCLSTLPVAPLTQRGLEQLTVAPRPVWLSGLFAGEAVWITYVAHEVLHPISGVYTRLYAPWSTLLAWLLLLALDIWAPVALTASLDRQCQSLNMDHNIYCSSGAIQVGSVGRTLLLGGINLASVAVCIGIVLLWKRRSVELDDVPCFLLPSSAVAFLRHQAAGRSVTESFDVVTATMMGILRLPRCYFDTKLWRVIDLDSHGIRLAGTKLTLPFALTPLTAADSSPGGDVKTQVSVFRRLKRRLRKLILVAGVGYTGLSLASNVAYLTVAQSFLANDYGWAGFNSTGMHAFLANRFNLELLLASRSANLDVTATSFADFEQRYDGSETSISWSRSAARRALGDPATPLTAIVQGLRDMDPCKLPWMFTQYCWLDFDKRWEMASTTQRQFRCQIQSTNGAVYLESGLRNINSWEAWEACWGSSFQVGIAAWLESTAAGAEWFIGVRSNDLSVADEAALWRGRHGISRFQLQWQNYKTIGFRDAFTVTSALGYMSALSLGQSSGSYHVRQQTSMRMYWSFASDLWAVATNATSVCGQSLVRQSQAFAFANTSAEELLYENLTLVAPINAGLDVVQTLVGPFGAIDLEYVLGPPPLLLFYASFRAQLASLLAENATAQAAYLRLPTWAFLMPVPSSMWAVNASLVVGGNMMCGSDLPAYAPTYGFYRGYGMSNACFANFLESTPPSTPLLLFASLGYHLTLPSADVAAICSLDAYSGLGCSEAFGAYFDFVAAHDSVFQTLSPLAHAARASVLTLGVEAAQFISSDGIGSLVSLYRINLLEPTDLPWNFYGWCYLYEWAVGNREVVMFEGDAGSVTVLSARTDVQSMSPDPGEVPVSFSLLCQSFNFYVSWVLIVVASGVAGFALLHAESVEGQNFFCLNRVIGHVWAGRTFLVVRSASAIWILTTSPLDLHAVGIVTCIKSPPLVWYDTILAASEVSWLVYVLNDIFTCYTEQYTAVYASKSSLLTSFIVSIWTFLAPQHSTVALGRTCTYVDMDFELACTSAAVAVGSPWRLAVVFCIALASITTSYVVGRFLWQPNLPPIPVKSWLLSAQSFYLLDFTEWYFQGEYFLDKTSAMMAGVLSVVYDGRLYLFDIKTWRLVSLPALHISLRDPDARRFRHAIPLSRI
ncbi:hypothetical protein ACHHYP_04976 [Achlya hypogyna]|uniref:Uncharacterized protein n=1 Tax=Achlya hypogyna TaxID=1202772 RepID=A0A1V9YZA2_ACHHY|nr:hypothetical protein ACHHYP_04976 [Achlya hypogyna]